MRFSFMFSLMSSKLRNLTFHFASDSMSLNSYVHYIRGTFMTPLQLLVHSTTAFAFERDSSSLLVIYPVRG